MSISAVFDVPRNNFTIEESSLVSSQILYLWKVGAKLRLPEAVGQISQEDTTFSYPLRPALLFSSHALVLPLTATSYLAKVEDICAVLDKSRSMRMLRSSWFSIQLIR